MTNLLHLLNTDHRILIAGLAWCVLAVLYALFIWAMDKDGTE
jgi:hypothetical protein